MYFNASYLSFPSASNVRMFTSTYIEILHTFSVFPTPLPGSLFLPSPGARDDGKKRGPGNGVAVFRRQHLLLTTFRWPPL